MNESLRVSQMFIQHASSSLDASSRTPLAHFHDDHAARRSCAKSLPALSMLSLFPQMTSLVSRSEEGETTTQDSFGIQFFRVSSSGWGLRSLHKVLSCSGKEGWGKRRRQAAS